MCLQILSKLPSTKFHENSPRDISVITCGHIDMAKKIGSLCNSVAKAFNNTGWLYDKARLKMKMNDLWRTALGSHRTLPTLTDVHTDSIIWTMIGASETSVSFYTTRRYIPEGCHLHTCRREKLKSHRTEDHCSYYSSWNIDNILMVA
jgi:hypothetical protein